MTSILLSGPSVEPISLSEAKIFLRVSGIEDDNLIETLIAAARVHIESVTRRALVTQDWRLTLDQWPENCQVELPVGPLQEFLDIRVFDSTGVPHKLPLSGYLSEVGSSHARIRLPRLPSIIGQGRKSQVEIDYRAGYGGAPGDVPPDLRQSLLTLIAHWYEHREAVLMAGSGSIVPLGFDNLIAGYRVPNL